MFIEYCVSLITESNPLNSLLDTFFYFTIQTKSVKIKNKMNFLFSVYTTKFIFFQELFEGLKC